MWTAIGAVASAVAAALSLVSIIVAGLALRGQGHAADVQACFAIIKQLGDAHRAVTGAPVEQKQSEATELMNILEAIATLANDKRLVGSTGKVLKRFLIEGLAVFRYDPSIAAFVSSMMTSDQTYSELRKFGKANEKEICSVARGAGNVRDAGL